MTALAGCTGAPDGNSEVSSAGHYEAITAEQGKTMMDDGEPFILVDVRTEAEYQEKRIDRSLLIPDDEIAARAETELPDKNARIIVYCRSGVRAEGAAKNLANLGYTQVYTIGGILSWPYDTVSG